MIRRAAYCVTSMRSNPIRTSARHKAEFSNIVCPRWSRHGFRRTAVPAIVGSDRNTRGASIRHASKIMFNREGIKHEALVHSLASHCCWSGSPRCRMRVRRPVRPRAAGSRCSTARTSTTSTRSVMPIGGSRTVPWSPTRATASWSPRTPIPTIRSGPNSGSTATPTAAFSSAAPIPKRSAAPRRMR